MAKVTKIESPRFQVELNEEEAAMVVEALMSIEGAGVELNVIAAFHSVDFYVEEYQLCGSLVRSDDEECE